MGLIILVRNRDHDGENSKWTNLTGTVLLISLELGFFLAQHWQGKKKTQREKKKEKKKGSLNLTYEPKAPPSGQEWKTAAFAQILFKLNRQMFFLGLPVSRCLLNLQIFFLNLC